MSETTTPRPPSDGAALKITSKGLRGMARVLVALGGIAAAGASSYAAHAFGDRQGAVAVDALTRRLDEHLQDAKSERADQEGINRDLQRQISDSKTEYSKELAAVHQSLQDMNATLTRIANELEAQRSAVLTRYQPRRPPVDRHRIEPAAPVP